MKKYLLSLLCIVSLNATQVSNINMKNTTEDKNFLSSNFEVMCLQNIPDDFIYENDDKFLYKYKSTDSNNWGKVNSSMGFLINKEYNKYAHTIVKYPDELLGDSFFKDPILYFNLENKTGFLNVNLIKGHFQSKTLYDSPQTLTKIELKELNKVITYFSSRFGFPLENLVICGEFNLDHEDMQTILSSDYNISNVKENETQHIITYNKTLQKTIKDENSKNFSLYSLIDWYNTIINQYY